MEMSLEMAKSDRRWRCHVQEDIIKNLLADILVPEYIYFTGFDIIIPSTVGTLTKWVHL